MRVLLFPTPYSLIPPPLISKSTLTQILITNPSSPLFPFENSPATPSPQSSGNTSINSLGTFLVDIQIHNIRRKSLEISGRQLNLHAMQVRKSENEEEYFSPPDQLHHLQS